MVPPVTIAVTILLLSVSSGVAAEHRGEPRLPHSSPAQAGQSAPAAGADVLAILPFDNISRAPGDDWIGAGIAETLMADLESIGGVAVVRLQAGTRALENQSDPQGSSTEATDVAAGRLVGARWVISGGYQRLGDRLRITTRVVEVATATVVHTAIVDGMVAELFVLQDRLATEVRRGVAGAGAARTVELTRAAVAPPAAPRTGDPVPAEVERAPASRSEPAEAGRSGFAAQTGPLVDGPPPPVAPDTLSRDAARRATVRAVRLTEPLRLDGTLDESIYETVPPVSGFIQQLPDEGEPTTEKTEAWIFFDARSVYVSARLWDSAPELLIANEMQRDAMQIVNNDYFSVVLDTFYDRRNGVAFTVNAIGGFLDYQITDEGNPNLDWNAIFDVRTGRFDGGWSLEMEIPFKSLRFRPGRSQVWGVQLGRRIRHKTEATFLTPVPINAVPGELRLSAAGTLVGVEVPAGNRTFEIKPFAIGSLATDVNTVPRVLNEGDGNFGFDLKYGVTESLTADFTVNTDFAQVEVDEQQVNLTRFSLFFPEKREFFLEGRGIFEFGRPAGGGVGVRRGGRGGGGPRGRADAGDVPTLFFSRRIGLNAGQTVPILGGGRLTGRAGGFSIGALNIQTDAAAAANALSTNFTVLRVKRDILRRSSIGGIFTGRSVSLAGQGSNEVYGLDTALSFFDNVNLNAYYARTRTPDLEGDSDSYQAAFSYSGDLYGFQIDHLLVGDNFNPEVGFLRRDDFRRTFTVGAVQPAASVAGRRAPVHVGSQPRLHRDRRRSGRDPVRAGAFRHRIREQRSLRRRCPAELRAAVAALPDCVRRQHPGRRLRLPRCLPVVLHGRAAPSLRDLVFAAWWVLQREHHDGRLFARPHRDYAAPVDRAGHVDQPHRSAGGCVHLDAGDEPHDLHLHPADVLGRPGAVQLRQRFAQHQHPSSLGVSAGQRDIRGL